MNKLLILCLFILSCNWSTFNNGKITSIEKYDTQSVMCKYHTDSGGNFVDTCGKFKVGDKVNFINYE